MIHTIGHLKYNVRGGKKFPPFLWNLVFICIQLRKNVMRIFILFAFVVGFAPSFFGQTVVRFSCIDRATKDPISQVAIHVVGNPAWAKVMYTNRTGFAYLTVPQQDSLQFEFEHVAYTAINPPPKQKYPGKSSDTVTVVVKMNFNKTREIAEVIIKPAGVPDTIFQSNRVSVQDFEFLRDGNLLLLTYPKNMRKETELVVYDGFELKGQIPLREKGTEIIRDYRGNPHVVTEKNVFGVVPNGTKMEIIQIDKAYYMTYIAPIVDTSVTNLYFSNYNALYPAFDYFRHDRSDSTYRKIAKVEDEFMMELYRSEYKWVDVRTKLWAKQKEYDTGIDAEIWVGANYFTQSVYYKELYAPLFERNDSIFLFDHYENWMFRYTKDGDIIDSIPIYYHLQPKQNGWKQQLLQDETTGQIYLVFEKAGQVSLRRFDVSTGKLGAVSYTHLRAHETG
jgi:hypothetical protein